ncbi:MAG: hypothetical protein ABWY78_17525 [Microvirga sp.]
MVETIMIFALGFLAASLLALLIIPAVNARAERLARRRVEALFPLSISELTAEKDHLRAEFAVLQRRIERRAEQAQAVKHTSMEELGRRAVRIEALETLLAQRDHRLSDLEGETGALRERLAAATEEATGGQATVAGLRDILNALEASHRATLDELATTRIAGDRTMSEREAARAEAVDFSERLTRRETEHADLERRLSAALGDLDAKRITVSDLETRLMTQTSRGDDFERVLGDRRSELSDERLRLADLARDLAAEQERGLLLDQRIRELEAEHAAGRTEAAGLVARSDAIARERDAARTSLLERQAAIGALETALQAAQTRILSLEAQEGRSGESHASDLRSLAEKLETLKSEKASAEGALSAAREERLRLERAIQSLRKSGDDAGVQAENAELRRRIVEVADLVMQDGRMQDAPMTAPPMQDSKPRPARSGRRRNAAK